MRGAVLGWALAGAWAGGALTTLVTLVVFNVDMGLALGAYAVAIWFVLAAVESMNGMLVLWWPSLVGAVVGGVLGATLRARR